MPVVFRTYTRRDISKIVFSLLLSGYTLSKGYGFQEADPDFDRSQLFARSGDPQLDRALIEELKRIVNVLQINPGFQYVDGDNAYALRKTLIVGTKGTVILGVRLIRKLVEA